MDTAVNQAGNPTTKVLRVTRTGALSLSKEETPLLLLGLAAGVAIGAALGLLFSRWGMKKAPTAAPPEPSVGRYDEVAVGEAPTAPDAVPPPTDGPPERPLAPSTYKKRTATDEYLPTVPEAESVYSGEWAPPLPRAGELEQAAWEEEPAPQPSAHPSHHPPSHPAEGRGDGSERRVMELLRGLQR